MHYKIKHQKHKKWINMQLKAFTLIILSLLSFSVFSSQTHLFEASSTVTLYSFTEFTMAFILGLSLPILLLSALMQRTVPIRWGYIVLIAISALALLTTLIYSAVASPVVIPTMAILYLTFVSLWPLNNDYAIANTREETNVFNSYKRKSIIKSSMAILLVTSSLYLVMLWLFPDTGIATGWLISSCIILAVSLTYLLKLTTKSEVPNGFRLRLLVLWASLVLFCAAFYLWLGFNVHHVYLVVMTAISFLLSLVVGCWLMVVQILSALNLGKKDAKNNTVRVNADEMFQITHDPATNLPNTQQALKYFELNSKRFPDHKFAVITFKPVNFKEVNSVLGYHNSDVLLLQLAYCIQREVADNDDLLCFDICPEPIRLVRLQSLQFMVICDLGNSGKNVEKVVSHVCDQISNAVPDAMSFKSFSLNFELAYGVSVTTGNGLNVSEVMAHATDALLTAEQKEERISYFDFESIYQNDRQLVFMERLRKDIVDQSLLCYLQPQIRCKDGDLIGFELLVHWYKRPEEPLELAEFIELAEYSGELYSLGKQMITEAIQAIATLQRLNHNCTVSVKLSSKMLLETDLIDFIGQQMKALNVIGNYLLIELTEDLILSSGRKTKRIIDQLRAIGIKIAIADFSGSYESLRYVRKSVIDQVKINCKDLALGDENRSERVIIDTLVSLSKGMKISVIGTHIERQEPLEIFKVMGGSIVQGNIIERGVVPEELELWFKKKFSANTAMIK